MKFDCEILRDFRVFRGRQTISKNRGEDRIKNDSRKGAKGAKLGDIGKEFSLRSLRSWRDKEKIGYKDDSPCGVLISPRAEHDPQGLTPRGKGRQEMRTKNSKHEIRNTKQIQMT